MKHPMVNYIDNSSDQFVVGIKTVVLTYIGNCYGIDRHKDFQARVIAYVTLF